MKVLKKLIWFIIFIIIAVVTVVLVYKAIIKFEFADEIKYKNINYMSTDKDICLKFTDKAYSLDDCSGGESVLPFNSSKKCSINYGRGYNSFIFKCGNKINLVKFIEYSFNKVKFTSNKKEYVLVNSSVFSTMEGLNKINFNFVDDKTIKFSKYLNDTLVDEEICNYKYATDESMGLECSRFYGYSSFKIEKYENNSVTIINRGNRIKFTLVN